MKQVSLWPLLSRIASRYPGIEALEARIAPAAVLWNKDADGNWDDPLNWSGNVVPGPNDDVTLPTMASAYQVTVRSGAQEVHSLTSAVPLSLTGGTLTLDTASSTHGDLTLNGGSLVINAAFDTYGLISWEQLGFSDASLTGTGTLTSHGTTELAGQLKLLNATFVNAGTFHANGSGLSTSSTGVLTNASGATMNLEGGFNFIRGTVSNAGTLNSTAGDQLFNDTFNNTGTVHVTGGTLRMSFGTNNGIFNIDTGTQLTFSVGPGGGTYHLGTGSQLNGDGLYENNGFEYVDIQSGVEVSPKHLQIQDFSNFGGAGQLTIASGSHLEWLGNAAVYGVGKTKIAAGGTVHVGGAVSNDQGQTLEIDGTVEIDAGKALRAHGGSAIIVGAGGLVNLTKDAALGVSTTGDSVNILAGGEVVALTSGFTAQLDGGGSNAGLVHAAAGATLRIPFTFNSTGQYQADPGSTIIVAGGGRMFPGAAWNGPGQYTIPSGTITLDAMETLSPLHLTLGGTIAGAGNLEIANGATLTLTGSRILGSGLMSGSGTTHVAAGGTITGSALNFAHNRVFINDGAVTVSSVRTDTTGVLEDGSLTNNATFNLLPDSSTGMASIETRATFYNTGTFHIDASGSLGATLSAVNNAGLLTISGPGTALFSGSTSTSTGELHVDSGATLHVAETFAFTGAATFTGGGLFNFDTTTVTLGTGVTLNPTNLRLFDGEIDGPGALAAGPGARWEIGVEILKNLGTFTISAGAIVQAGNDNYDNRLFLTGTNIDNFGELDLLTGHNASLSYTDASTFTNETTGVVNFGHQSYGFSQMGGTVVNRGVITADPGTTGGYYFQVGSVTYPFDNPGTLILKSGTASVGGQIPQLSPDGTKLLGGTWEALGGSWVNVAYAAVSENDANVTISGPGAKFSEFALTLQKNAGYLGVLEGASLTVGPNGMFGQLTNTGTLEIGNGSVVQVHLGDFTQTSAGTLLLHVGGTAASGKYGQLVTEGVATFDGALQLTVDSDPIPPAGNVYPLLSFASVSGQFATENGVAPFFLETPSATGVTFTIQSVPSDLLPTGVTLPPSGSAGQNVTIGYTVHNGATVITNASHWTDSIYLSTSATFDGSAILLGRVVHQGSLAGGANYNGSLTAPLPTLLTGDYHLFVVTDSRNEVAELSESNNVFAATSTIHVDVPVLTVGTPLNGTIANGQDELFKVHLPAGADHFTLHTNAPGLAEIYVSKNAPPAVNGADFYAFDPGATTQEITVPDGGGADYYVLLHGREGAAAGVGFTLDAEALPFEILSLGTLAATNNGSVTIAVHGAQFTAATSFTLTPHGGGSALSSTKLQLQDGTLEYATFDLTGLAAGQYDLAATDHSSTVTLANGFNVLPAPLGDPGVQVILSLSAPALIRSGRPGTVVVFYQNLSGHDVPAPLLVLSSDNVTFLDGDEQYSKFIEFYGLNTGGGDDTVLPAGYHGSRVLQYLPEVEGAHLVSHLYLNPATTTAPLDLDKLDIEARPTGDLTDAQWALVRAQLATQLGPNYGTYANVLRGDIHLLPAVDGDHRSPIDLLSIEVQKAEAAVFTSIHGQLGAAPTGVSLAGGLVLAHNTVTGAVFSAYSLNDGSFTFRDVAAGSYTFEYDQALVTNATSLAVTAGQHNVPVTLGLTLGAALSGSLGPAVTTGDVVATGSDGSVHAALVDATGHYRFGALPAGTYSVTAEADGFAPSTLTNFTIALGENTHNFTLTGEGTIAGHVTVDKGGPAGDLPLISAVSTTNPNAPSFTVQAGADGSYTLHNLPADTYSLTFDENGYITGTIASLAVTAGHTATAANVALLVAGSISGTVTGDSSVNEQIGAFLNGALVGSALTGTDGKYTIPGLAPGSYAVHAVGNGQFSSTKTVTLAEGKALTGVALTSYAGGQIAGTVHLGTATGAVFAGVSVTATDTHGTVYTTHADAQGHYEFDGLATGSYSVVLQGGSGTAGAAKVAVATLQTHTTKDLVSNATGRVHGLLTLDGQTPLQGGLVELLDAQGHLLATSTTGADGLYFFQISATGALTLRAASDSGTFADSPVTVAAGQDVTANLTGGTGSLHVPVTDPGGTVTGANLALVQVSTGVTVNAVALDASGVADFSHLAPGDYTLYVTEAGNRGALATVTVGAGVTNAPLTVAPQGALSGHVTGMPAGSGAQVYAKLAGASGVSFSVAAAPDGSYALNNLPAGAYTVTAVSNGLAAPVQKTGVSVTSGSTTSSDLPVTTSGGRLVDGKIVDVNGFAIPDATVQFIDDNGNFIGQAIAGDDGSFEVRLPVGTVRLKIFTKDNAPVDFFGTLQVNEPKKDEPQDIGDLVAAFANSGSSGEFNPLYAVLNGLNRPNLTNIFKLYDSVKMDATDQFKKSKDHVNDIPNGSACPGCYQEFIDAGDALVAQNKAFDDWMKDLKTLIADSLKGESAIQKETDKNLRTTIEIAVALPLAFSDLIGAIGALSLEGVGLGVGGVILKTAAEVIAEKGVTRFIAEAINNFVALYNGVSDLVMQVNDGFQPSDSASQDAAYVTQVSSGTNNIVGSFSTLVTTVRELEGAAGVAFKSAVAVTAFLDKIINYQETMEALKYTASQEAADKVVEDLAKFKEDKEPYQVKATYAHVKKQTLLDCMKNNAANPNCNPNPVPGKPNNRPLPPDGPLPGDYGTPSAQVRALDPNSLDGPAGFGDSHFVSFQNPLAYTIHFENVATATAPAAEVLITEQLDTHLDFKTFQLGDFTFGDLHIAVPAGHSQYSVHHFDATASLGVLVDFDASVNLQTGLVTWDLKAIDPATGDVPGDATKGFLPPNVTAPEGEGSVSYTVSAKTTAHTGDVIGAQASIVFDANDAINTPTFTNTLDAVAPTSHVTLPSSAGTDFTVSWTGNDDNGGSGIAFYDVYVKDDNVAGSKFQPFVLHDTHTAGVFTGISGHTYEFFSVAQDGAGNREAQPVSAQATITLHDTVLSTITAGHAGHFIDALGKGYTVTLTGPGQVVLSFVNGVDAAQHADIRALLLTSTTSASTLTVTEAKGGSIHVGRIESGTASLGAITLGAGVILGDGLDDASADLHVGGSLNQLTLSDVNNHAIVQVGDRLTSALAAKATPVAVTVGNVLGDDVHLDFSTRAGAIKVQSWHYAGSLEARLGAASLTVTTGDLVAAVDVASGNLGPVSISNGGLTDGNFTVAGTLTSLTTKSFLNGNLTVGSAGNLTVGGFFGATVVAQTGSLGNITSTSAIVSSDFTAAHGKIGNIAVQLAKQAANVNAVDNAHFSAQAIGNVTASVAGATGLTAARGIINSAFTATTGNLGAISANVTGAGLTDGVAIEESSFTAAAGNIGNVSATATSAAAAPFLIALRGTSLQAGGNLGNLTAIAQATSAHPTGGSVSAILDELASSSITAGHAIGAFTATASGSANAVAIGVFEGFRLTVSAGTSLGAVTVTTTAAAGQTGFGLSRTSFLAGTTIGAVKVSGTVTDAQVFDTAIIAGGRIASVSVTAKDGVDGSFNQGTIIAGWNQALHKVGDLAAGGIGSITVSGNLADSKIGAAGTIGAISVALNATGDLIVAGDRAGADRQLLTADDIYERAGSITSLHVGGLFATTTVAAGIDPGADRSFGGADDTLGLAVAGLPTGHLGAVVLGAVNANAGVTNPFVPNPVLPHLYALESAALTSITVSKLKPLTNFTAPLELSPNGLLDPANELIRKIS